ncbi:hypothetical protein [Pseudonocardia spirodelae]|uniref:DUF1508 domain-containing protein n=1 Tax=Pseudonocardia spirodelae TaxID=3133431 RepID=A0ABU8T9L6_9PSEU
MPHRSRWTSFVAPGTEPPVRTLHEEGNPAHRVRVEHDGRTLLVHLSGEDGPGWTCLAVDRDTRAYAVRQDARQADAAAAAVRALRRDDDTAR